MSLVSRRRILLALSLFLLVGCDRAPGHRPEPTVAAVPEAGEQKRHADTSFRFTASGRVVAIGDLHGDLKATRNALRVAGIIDENDKWNAGTTVLVQTGDILDRGDDEREILDLFDRLMDEAEKAGGAIHILLGNHEVMNVQGDLRYVTPGGFSDFESVVELPMDKPILLHFPPHARARAWAFLPGGTFARRLSRFDTVIMVNDTLFAHGGALPTHVHYGFGKLNRDMKAWMQGERPQIPAIMLDEDGPIWNRRFSTPVVKEKECRTLDTVLDQVGAKRLVVGHTPQKGGITSACDDHVWRIDIGMGFFYGATPPQALAIDGDKVTVLPP